jgi:DNA-directed RNA polymerase specialized sigma24 family protein
MVERAHAEIRRRGDDGVVVSFEDRVDATDSMHAALLKLPVDQRAVIVLRHLEDLSEQETARVAWHPAGHREVPRRPRA